MCQRRNPLDYFGVFGSQLSSRLRFGLSCIFVCDLDVWTTSHSKPRQLTFAIGWVHHNMQGAPGWHHHLCHLANESLSTHTQMGPESTGRSSFYHLPKTWSLYAFYHLHLTRILRLGTNGVRRWRLASYGRRSAEDDLIRHT